LAGYEDNILDAVTLNEMMKKHNKALLEKLYSTMIRIRMCEENFVNPILNGEIRCPVHLYSGQEAIATGVCSALSVQDYVLGNHRSHGHYIAKGGSLKELVAEIYGRNTGCSRGRGGSMHVCAPEKGILGAVPIVGGTISLAVGVALASKIRNDQRVTVSFFGDGATGEGVLYESLNFAALKKLAMIFVCENNFYSTHLPVRECRPALGIFKIAIPFGISSFKEDGNDVLKVYEVAKNSVKICKDGEGPVFLEFLTYRQRGHVGPDDNIQGTHTDIRPKAEIEKWKKKDPIIRFERFLLKGKFFEKRELAILRKKIDREVKDAFASSQKSPYPKESELTDYVFEE